MPYLFFSNDCVNGLRLWTGVAGPRYDEDEGNWIPVPGCQHVTGLERHHFPDITDPLHQGDCIRVAISNRCNFWSKNGTL